jgi:hypothetical protein
VEGLELVQLLTRAEARRARRRRQLADAYIAGYDQAVEDFRAYVSSTSAYRRERLSYLRRYRERSRPTWRALGLKDR